jgi:hypothetical protein
MAKDPFSDDVRAITEQQQRVIYLVKAQKVIVRRAPGRPSTIPLGARRGWGYPWRTPSGHRLRCRARFCNRTLAKTATTCVCSDACAARLRRECEIFLGVLDGTLRPEDVPPDLRAFNQRTSRAIRQR